MTNQELEIKGKHIRKNIVNMVHEAGCGHPGGSLSAVEIMLSIYGREMNINKDNVASNERDKFVLSKGHAAPVLYSTLAEFGFIDEAELPTLRKLGSKLQGHPNMNYVQAIDMSTGSLGQGISCAVGMALSNKIHKNDYRIYTLLGDGECQEGEVWEAAMAAAHYKLDNLCAVVDHNGLQIDGKVTDVMNPTPIDEKFKAFGWNVVVVKDGNSLDELNDAFKVARETKGQPTMILAHTVKGKGVSFMENNAGWHGKAPNDEEFEIAMKELGGND